FAGTADGITGFQMDMKIQGVTFDVMRTALEQAKGGRLHILEQMNRAISEPRETMSRWAPRIISIQIPKKKIRDVIGAGGKVIRQITAETGTEINVEDDGTIQIAATSGEAAEKAIKWIEGLTKDVEVGKEYLGKVTRIMNFGAFVEILPGKEGLVHISQLADYRVPRVEDVVSLGDALEVRVDDIDPQGKVSLSPIGDDADGGGDDDGGSGGGNGRDRAPSGSGGGERPRSRGGGERGGGERGGGERGGGERGRGDRDRGRGEGGRGEGGRGGRSGSDAEAPAPPGVATVSFEEAFDAEVGREFGDLGPEAAPSGDRGGEREGRSRRGGRRR
ncbi:MAG: S1 RNA-binding domain-containing protein, partial [Actinobacteria bacterium]|nr:S1 RNA-binding domain-containing protein [Actinomycetota bacterium]